MRSAVPSAVSPAVGREFLEPNEFMDWDAPVVGAFAQRHAGSAGGDAERAVRLYYAVRDGVRYDPYAIRPQRETFRASHVVEASAAFCIPKAILLAAAARAVGIPAAIGLADVKNHLTTQKLRDAMGTDIFIYHGYTVLHLGGRWVKATPAFNVELCRKFDVPPLEFDGKADSLMLPYDRKNQRHMEYLKDHGWFAEFPFERVLTDFRKVYPRLFDGPGLEGVFEQERPLRP